MAMTLRLDEATQSALERIVQAEGISANAAVARALAEYDAKRTALRDRLIAEIVEKDKALLDRLAQ